MSAFRPGGIIWLPEGVHALDAGEWLAGLKPWAPPKIEERHTAFFDGVRHVIAPGWPDRGPSFFYPVKESPLP